MMGTITVVFILCVAPYFIYFLAPGKAEAKEKILPYIVMLMYLNSLINPLLYICINSSIRKATLKLLSCQRTQEFVLGETYQLEQVLFTLTVPRTSTGLYGHRARTFCFFILSSATIVARDRHYSINDGAHPHPYTALSLAALATLYLLTHSPQLQNFGRKSNF